MLTARCKHHLRENNNDSLELNFVLRRTTIICNVMQEPHHDMLTVTHPPEVKISKF